MTGAALRRHAYFLTIAREIILMGAKTRLSTHLNSIEDLELTLSELNQSVAYLSKMVLQLQRSINANQRNRQGATQELSESKPETLH